jgi:hypothetical protein
MLKFLSLLSCLLMLTVGQISTLSATAADLRVAPSQGNAVVSEDQRHAAISNYLTLLLIRATFDVVALEDVEGLLRRQLDIWGQAGPSPDEIAFVNRMLLAEGSYYLVSLTYLIKVGGAAFPADRPDANYQNDALVELDSLRSELISRTLGGEDALDLMARAEGVRALTEAQSVVSPELSIISRHDEILAMAMPSRDRLAL